MLAPLLSVALTLSQANVKALTDKVQAHYDAVRDFEADFVQRYERRFLHRVVEESGKVWIKKPGRMRWEYENPETKLFVTDGARSYFYIPSENQVIVSHQPEGAMGMEEGSPFELLAGKARITDSFTFFASDSEPQEGGVMLHLVPMTRREEYEDVELEVDPADGRVLRVVLVDAQRNRTEFLFRKVRENLHLPETLFRFAVPPEAEVIIHSPGTGDDR
jgi:outer membrane lipoprotein carrier protein